MVLDWQSFRHLVPGGVALLRPRSFETPGVALASRPGLQGFSYEPWTYFCMALTTAPPDALAAERIWWLGGERWYFGNAARVVAYPAPTGQVRTVARVGDEIWAVGAVPLDERHAAGAVWRLRGEP